MGKLTQADIKTEAEKWAGYENRITKILQAETAELTAAEDEYNRKCQEIRDRYAVKTGPLQIKADMSQQVVIGWLDKQKKPMSLETAKAIAVLEITPASTIETGRACDPQTFIRTAEAAKKGPWSAIKVLLGEADKLLGVETMEKICTKATKATPETRTAYLKLKV
jgi:hypothetical protein